MKKRFCFTFVPALLAAGMLVLAGCSTGSGGESKTLPATYLYTKDDGSGNTFTLKPDLSFSTDVNIAAMGGKVNITGFIAYETWDDVTIAGTVKSLSSDNGALKATLQSMGEIGISLKFDPNIETHTKLEVVFSGDMGTAANAIMGGAFTRDTTP